MRWRAVRSVGFEGGIARFRWHERFVVHRVHGVVGAVGTGHVCALIHAAQYQTLVEVRAIDAGPLVPAVASALIAAGGVGALGKILRQRGEPTLQSAAALTSRIKRFVVISASGAVERDHPR